MIRYCITHDIGWYYHTADDTCRENPLMCCGLCDAKLWQDDDIYGPYLGATSLDVVCGTCAPRLTKGVL